MVDRRKAFNLISSRDHYQRSSPSRISDTPQAAFQPAQYLSSSLVEWSCAVVITTTPRCSGYHFFFNHSYESFCFSITAPLVIFGFGLNKKHWTTDSCLHCCTTTSIDHWIPKVLLFSDFTQTFFFLKFFLLKELVLTTFSNSL